MREEEEDKIETMGGTLDSKKKTDKAIETRIRDERERIVIITTDTTGRDREKETTLIVT